MGHQLPMGVEGLQGGNKAVDDQDSEEYEVGDVEIVEFIFPGGLAIPPQQSHFEEIVEDDGHDEGVPGEQPSVFRGDGGPSGSPGGHDVIDVAL